MTSIAYKVLGPNGESHHGGTGRAWAARDGAWAARNAAWAASYEHSTLILFDYLEGRRS